MSQRFWVVSVLAAGLFVIGCDRPDDIKPVNGVTISPPPGSGNATPNPTAGPVVPPTINPPATVPDATTKPIAKPTTQATAPKEAESDVVAKAGSILTEAKEAIDALNIDLAAAKLKSLETVKDKLPAEKRSQLARYQDQLQTAKAIKEHKPELGR